MRLPVNSALGSRRLHCMRCVSGVSAGQRVCPTVPRRRSEHVAHRAALRRHGGRGLRGAFVCARVWPAAPRPCWERRWPRP